MHQKMQWKIYYTILWTARLLGFRVSGLPDRQGYTEMSGHHFEAPKIGISEVTTTQF
jgi:hypothetical protein